MDGNSIVAASNIHGLRIVQAHHISRSGPVGVYRCPNMLTVTGEYGFSIQQLDIEKVGPHQTDAAHRGMTSAARH